MRFQLWGQWYSLLRWPTGETKPTIERSGPAFTAAAWFDTHDIRGALDDITETDLLIGDESR